MLNLRSFYKTQRFTTVFKRTYVSTLLWANYISPYPHILFLKGSFNSILLCIPVYLIFPLYFSYALLIILLPLLWRLLTFHARNLMVRNKVADGFQPQTANKGRSSSLVVMHVRNVNYHVTNCHKDNLILTMGGTILLLPTLFIGVLLS